MELLKWYQVRNKVHDASGIEHPEQWWWGLSTDTNVLYPQRLIVWEDCPRDDLNQIPMAISKGWQPDFNSRDKRNGRIVPHDVPADCVSFVRGNVHTWKCYKHEEPFSYWRVADLVDHSFVNRRDYDTLPEVFANEL
jgi:hypothetical protein